MNIIKNLEIERITSYNFNDKELRIEFFDSDYNRKYKAIFELFKVKDNNLEESKKEEDLSDFTSRIEQGDDIINKTLEEKNTILIIELSNLGEISIGFYRLKRTISEDYIHLKFSLEELAINDKIPIQQSKSFQNCQTDNNNSVIMNVSDYNDNEINNIIKKIDLQVEEKDKDHLLIKGYFGNGPDVAPY